MRISGGPGRPRLTIAGLLVVTAISSAIPIVVDGWWLFISSPGSEAAMPARVALSVSTWISVLAGLVAYQRRPVNPIGPWLIVSGILGPLGFLVGNGSSLVIVLSWAAFSLSATLGAAVPISFPSGRLDGRAPILIAIVAVTTVVYRAAEVLFFDPLGSIAGWTQPNPFYVKADPAFLDLLSLAMNVYGIVFLVAFGGWLARRWLSLTGPARRSIAPVLAGALVFVVTSVAQASVEAAHGSASTRDMVQFAHTLSFGAIPLGVAIGLLRLRMARGAVAELVVELGETPEPAVLRKALATALGDPSLQVVLWSGDGYLDEAGRRVASLDAVAAGRAITLLERDGSRLAAILHDPGLLEDPGLVASVAAAVRLSVENARLQEAVEAQLAEVRASRVRIVEATDAERRRLERDIHDGAQQRLVALSMALGRARSQLPRGTDPELEETLSEAAAEARAAIGDLRELARGIHPAILTQAGLEPALRSLADRAAVAADVSVQVTRRLPERIEATAYFVVAEALTNVAKHAQATSACVTAELDDGRLSLVVRDDGCGGADVSRGSGLRGLRDRVEAMGGSFEVTSAEGSGTTVRATLPVEGPA